MHSSQHPNSGKRFRIQIDAFDFANVDAQAGYDQMLHGSMAQLIDWADRMELDKELTPRKINVARAFYAHRCLPHLENPDAGFDLTGLVYVMRESEFKGQMHRIFDVLREHELVETAYSCES